MSDMDKTILCGVHARTGRETAFPLANVLYIEAAGGKYNVHVMAGGEEHVYTLLDVGIAEGSLLKYLA